MTAQEWSEKNSELDDFGDCPQCQGTGERSHGIECWSCNGQGMRFQ